MSQGFSIPGWFVAGVVTDVRQLKTKEGTVFAYSLNVMAIGGTYELTTRDESLIKGIRAGQNINAEGTFSTYNGRLKLDITSVKFNKAA